MASSYSTDLKLELMVTGEKAGQWGDITNTNLVILQQAIAGYQSVAVTNATTGATFAFTDGVTSNGKNAVIELTGTITTSVNFIVPDGIEKTYILKNSTSGAHQVIVKTTSGTGATFDTADKGYKLVYSDGTDVVDVALASPPGGSDKQIQFNDNGAFGGITMGTAGQILSTDGTTASFTDPAAGGAQWQAVITADPANATVGYGYFCDTSGGAFTVTLPTSPSQGDFISFVDYARTFDTNALTIGRNGHNIAGSAADLTVSVEGAGFTLVYVDSTQGWLIKDQ